MTPTISLPHRLLITLVILGVFLVTAWRSPSDAPAPFSPSDLTTGALLPHSDAFASTDPRGYVHAPTVTALPDGTAVAAWFTGTREGARDVEIRQARLLPGERLWQTEERLVTRAKTARATGRYIRKLGNPVLATAPDGRLWLFYVSVSLGGWAGSAINVMHSDDGGQRWSRPKRLITTPFFNISTLVRSPPVFHADGSIGLPVYHECFGKFGEYLRLDRSGRVLGKHRMSHGRHSLQPVVVPVTEDRAVALMRYAGEAPGYVWANESHDRGQTWGPLRPLPIHNPNSSVAAVRVGKDRILVAANDLPDGRHRLRLFESDDQLARWSLFATLDAAPEESGGPHQPDAFESALEATFNEQSDAIRREFWIAVREGLPRKSCKHGDCEFKYDYPFMIQTADGRVQIVYSWNNSFVKHRTFTLGKTGGTR